nr:MAG TPA: hypothetical protein [Caudoviricetes sp.]
MVTVPFLLYTSQYLAYSCILSISLFAFSELSSAAISARMRNF